MPAPITIVIAIYDGVTHLDFTGPHQFLSRLPDAKVIVASMGGADIHADNLVFTNLEDLASIGYCDVLCVPGGGGCTAAMQNADFVAVIRHLGLSAQYITSVCTGSLLLGAAGLLQGKRAACHWAWRDLLIPFGAIPDTGRVVRDGNILTGGGVTAGIDFVLTLIAELQGDDVAQRIQLMLEYAPAPPFSSGRPDTAPQAIVDVVRRNMQPFVKQRQDDVALAAERMAG
ncbi:DJ-1/PfpI family protein [Phyllobacterium sp. 628]|uniref:DJ-1/PfpI family protein n=1 Tax=Phyllobacterium sp. 628 TaxID=2718938 RepID=UPI0016626E0E|nr:DJ-1/PfpI family protein [Phyllobacterium sp. 628]QND53137.1 DJ-1/PfpI family protein [Phyllobacterium sp. 628]